ncbi:MAG: dihydrolipoamide dehydrogenase [Alphaproteobacteria bacterium]|nr:dihydrolipoamide dehydrogenase [Alphaproteobacteria bacterium]
MSERIEADLCVIGAGSAGLSAAAGAAILGLKVVLFERGRMGGDCLNYGCVPSKALLAAAKTASRIARAGEFGIRLGPAEIDYAAAMDRVRAVIAAIAPTDSVARFTALGVRVIEAEASFVGPRRVAGGGVEVDAKWLVVATGSRPSAPPIPGLAETPYLTNETLFDNRARPSHLIVIGGGPIGLEMAQAHIRLSSQVTVLEAARVLGKDDPELANAVTLALRAEGVAIREGAPIASVARGADGVSVTLDDGTRIAGSHLLVAAGRKPRIEGLGLERAGIAHGPAGIVVDRRLRTSNPRVYALGDVAGGPQFTHVAGWHAGLFLRNALFRLPASVVGAAIPAVTYTDPELAQVGMTEAAARAQGHAVRILRFGFADNDRAQAEGETRGLVKAVVDPRGRILGAGIAGPAAGELIQPWVLAMSKGLKIGALAEAIAAYPTLVEVNKRAATSFYAPLFLAKRTKTLVRWLLKLA